MQVIRLWQLPSNFFTLTSSQQWDVIESITYPATAYPNAGPRQRRTPCAISIQDDFLAVVFFLVTLGIPLVIAMSIVASITAATGPHAGSVGNFGVPPFATSTNVRHERRLEAITSVARPRSLL